MRRTKITAGVALSALLLSTAAASSAVAEPAPSQPADASFSQMAENPAIMAQRTASGKFIKDLRLQGDELYTGYGDYNANTGPINVASVNVKTNQVTNWLSTPTEEISNYKEIDGALYAPQIDPTMGWNEPVGYATNASGSWENINTTAFVHIYDITSTDGSDIWLAGSANNSAGTAYAGAVLKRSTDGGKTWTTEKEETSRPSINSYDRYYWAAGADGKLFASPYVNRDEGVPIQYWENGVWNVIPGSENGPKPSIASADRTVTFKDRIFYPGGPRATAPHQHTVDYIDGKQNTLNRGTELDSHVVDLYATDNSIFALTLDGKVWQSDEGELWKPITGVNTSSEVQSLAVDDTTEMIYVAGANGKVYQGSYANLASRDIPTLSGLSDLSIVQDASFDLRAGVSAADWDGMDLSSRIAIDASKLNPSVPGTYEVIYSVKGRNQSISAKRSITVEVDQTKAPEFSGLNQGFTLEGQEFDPLEGVRALDLVDGDVSYNIVVTGAVDSSKIGTYRLTYKATNSRNLTTIAARSVVVHREGSVILGADDLALTVGDSFDPMAGIEVIAPARVDENGAAVDNTSLIELSGSVDSSKPGSYVLTYSYVDQAGLITSVKRIVAVKAPSAPLLSGIEAATVGLNKAFDPLEGVSAQDVYDGDLTGSIRVEGTINTKVASTTKLTYTVTNSKGGTSKMTRSVTVTPNRAPVISLNVSSIPQGSQYDPYADVVVTDPDGDEIVSLKATTTVKTAKLGSYKTTYVAKDSQGKSTTKSFTVTVDIWD